MVADTFSDKTKAAPTELNSNRCCLNVLQSSYSIFTQLLFISLFLFLSASQASFYSPDLDPSIFIYIRIC